MVKSIFLRLFKDVYPLYQPVHMLEQTVVADGFIGTAAQVSLLVVDFAGKDKMAGKHGLFELGKSIFLSSGDGRREAA